MIITKITVFELLHKKNPYSECSLQISPTPAFDSSVTQVRN